MQFNKRVYKGAFRRTIRRIRNLEEFGLDYHPRLRRRQHELVLLDRRWNREHG